MSGKNTDKIRQIIAQKLSEASGNCVYATIKEVDEKKRTCKAQIGNIIYEDILLYSVENPDLKGFVFIPSIDSIVLVSRMGTDRMYAVMFSEIDKVLFTLNDLEVMVDKESVDIQKGDTISIHIDKSVVEIDADKIRFNGGDLGGLVKIGELKKNLDSLKTFVEAMHTALPSAFSAILAAMSANGANGAQAYTSLMEGKGIQFEDMENPKVTH